MPHSSGDGSNFRRKCVVFDCWMGVCLRCSKSGVLRGSVIVRVMMGGFGAGGH